MQKMIIQKYIPGQEGQISSFIREIYDEFVAVDYGAEGNQYFYEWIDPARIATRQQKYISLFTAWIESELAGMIEMRENNTISLLFTAKKFHRRGIAKKLVQAALTDCLKKDPELRKIYVHASPFSIPIYRKLGFKATEVMQEENGIKYLPMSMEIKSGINPYLSLGK